MKNNLSAKDIDYILSPAAIRKTTSRVYENALAGGTHFRVHEDKLADCTQLVTDVIYDNYPSLEIPFHSRWGHFKVGAVDRVRQLDDLIVSHDKIEKARKKIELAITSVLLDAGAGAKWKYKEIDRSFNRSEGLAVASFHMFLAGEFSHDQTPMASAQGLKNFTSDQLEKGFQVDENNPLVGVAGRVELIQKLGECVANNPYFPGQRPGSMIDYLIENKGEEFKVSDILEVVLKGLGSIWPGRIDVAGTNLGDVWHYPKDKDIDLDTIVCFHKLSQWLTYSLVEPMEDAGLRITDAHELTGLAEYRNGGLFLDFGVLELRDKSLSEIAHPPHSDIIIEWRALTVQLLDRIAKLIQEKLNMNHEQFPLAKVLEGGTWWAGRKLAAQLREDNSPPLKLESDGTVF